MLPVSEVPALRVLLAKAHPVQGEIARLGFDRAAAAILRASDIERSLSFVAMAHLQKPPRVSDDVDMAQMPHGYGRIAA